MASSVNLGTLVGSVPLQRDQEICWASAARNGDAVARERLIRASLRLVALRVFALGIPAADREDAFQSGVLGLLAAVDRFDPDRGVRLATYAWPWITAAIRSGVPDPLRPAPAEPIAEDDPADAEVRSDLIILLSGLPALMADVMRLRFGLGDGSGVTRSRATVAARLNLTVGEVRSVEANALANLRRRLARLGHRAPGPTASGADPL